MKEEKKEIAEERFELRSKIKKIQTGGKKVVNTKFINLLVLVFTILVIGYSVYYLETISSQKSIIASQSENTTNASVLTLGDKTDQSFIPAPTIRINFENYTSFETSTPAIDFMVIGSNLDTVLLSADGGTNITIPHDGLIAKMDFARGNPLFIDDFSKVSDKWSKGSAWKIVNGEYTSSNGESVAGDENWDNYVVEAKVKIGDGKGVNYVGVRLLDGQMYAVHSAKPDELRLIKSPPYTILSSTKIKDLYSGWHIWKIELNGTNIKVYIDGTKYLEYDDNYNPILKGKVMLLTEETTAYLDYISVYKPFNSANHSLTIFANNTAGNSNELTRYFTTLSNTKSEVTDIAGINETLTKSGIQIIVKKIYTFEYYTNIWVSVKNIEEKEKPFKLSPPPLIIDNLGNQYENIKYPGSVEISQNNLFSQANREGAIFFEPMREGSKPQKLILYINGEKFEFTSI